MPTPRKSVKQKLLEGNPGRKPIRKTAAKLPPSDGAPPEYLSAEGKKLWEQYVPRLRQSLKLTAIDEPMLFLLAANWGLAQQAFDLIVQNGLVVADRRSGAAMAFKETTQLLLQLSAKFGLSPADRVRIFGLVAPDGDDLGRGSTLDGYWPADKPRKSSLNGEWNSDSDPEVH